MWFFFLSKVKAMHVKCFHARRHYTLYYVPQKVSHWAFCPCLANFKTLKAYHFLLRGNAVLLWVALFFEVIGDGI